MGVVHFIGHKFIQVLVLLVFAHRISLLMIRELIWFLAACVVCILLVLIRRRLVLLVLLEGVIAHLWAAILVRLIVSRAHRVLVRNVARSHCFDPAV